MVTQFEHAFLERLPVRQINLPSGRVYEVADGVQYPSVTNILSQLPNPGIEKWKKWKGPEEAERIKKRATDRGTALHSAVEQYLLNDPIKIESPWERAMFSRIKPVLKDRLNNIRLLEAPLYSHGLRMAGTIDCLADFDGKLTIVDFKTSTNAKKEEYLSGYYAQCGAYWYMVKEKYLLSAEQCAILVATEDLNVAQVFIKPPKECFGILKAYVQSLVEYRRIDCEESIA